MNRLPENVHHLNGLVSRKTVNADAAVHTPCLPVARFMRRHSDRTGADFQIIIDYF